jgi:hypothetical protein
MIEQVIAAAGGNRLPSEYLERAYREARDTGYLWHECGDSHLIIGASDAQRRSGIRS